MLILIPAQIICIAAVLTQNFWTGDNVIFINCHQSRKIELCFQFFSKRYMLFRNSLNILHVEMQKVQKITNALLIRYLDYKRMSLILKHLNQYNYIHMYLWLKSIRCCLYSLGWRGRFALQRKRRYSTVKRIPIFSFHPKRSPELRTCIHISIYILCSLGVMLVHIEQY